MKYFGEKFKALYGQGLGRNKKGFTLVELIVVIAILVILISLMVPNIIGYIQQAEQTACSVNMNTLINEYTIKAVTKYGMNSVDSKLFIQEVANDHNGTYNESGTSGQSGLQGSISGVCPAGGDYVCTFTDDLLTVSFVCSKHGAVKWDVAVLTEKLSGLQLNIKSGSTTYNSIEDYFKGKSYASIDSGAAKSNTGWTNSNGEKTSLAGAIEASLKEQGIDLENRSWSLERVNNGTEVKTYTMVLSNDRVSVEDVSNRGKWVKVDKYDLKTGEVVTGYAKIEKGTGEFNVMKNFQAKKPDGEIVG